MTTKRNTAGFTLMEVMIVTAIIVILAGIAYSAYTSQIVRTNRADAHAGLNDVAHRMQRCYTLYSSYVNATDCAVYSALDSGGVESPEGFYRVDVSNDTATTYTLTATAIKAPQMGDQECNIDNKMTLTHTGRRAPDACW